MYSVLIVDDEPHVLDALQSLLEEQSQFQLDIYRAESGRDALGIVTQINIDLIISDVRMPDIDGLQLLENAVKFRPFCKVMFLTAYPSFEYAYEGIRKGLISYVLKTESDAVLLEAIENALTKKSISCTMRTPESKSALIDRQLWTVCFPTVDADDVRHNLLPYMSTASSLFSVGSDISGLTILAFQFECSCFPVSFNPKVWLESVLDDVERRLRKPTKIVSIHYDVPPFDLSAIASSCLVCMNRRISDPSRLVYVCSQEEALQEPAPISSTKSTANFMIRFIQTNIDSEITLLRLSNITGYSPDYLSDIFKKETGESFKTYLNRAKLERIRVLLNDESLSIDEIVSKLSFCTRSYFNRFIKRETGLTPKQFRQHIRDSKT